MPKQLPPCPWQAIERAIERDPARRGLVSRPEVLARLRGQLRAAAEGLARDGRAVAIVTGFAVRAEDGQWTAETDGPPGAVLLAKCLMELGIEVRMISDRFGVPLLEAAADRWGWPRELILTFPLESPPDRDTAASVPSAGGSASDVGSPHSLPQADRWVRRFWTTPFGRSLTHLIAIERVGPSHRLQSLRCQPQTEKTTTARFRRQVPPSARDVCHNMRGQSIHRQTGQTHLLFETSEQRPGVATIGVGDGGNEIGMGRLPWSVLADALPSEVGGRIACRIPTDHTVVAGISDWGAYALAAATSCLRGRASCFEACRVAEQRLLIETLVHEAGAVDGVTRRREATVDGLPLETYLQPLVGIRRALGFGIE